jgi:multicomponent Na+:H+ antiporter subunit C
MDAAFVITVGGLVTAAVYMFLARDLPRVLIGFVLLGTAANLAIFASGRLGSMTPPLVASGAETLAAHAANPLPQALILTAIVIGFGLSAFALMLIVRAHAEFGTVAAEDMDAAEGDETDAAPDSPGARPTPADKARRKMEAA